MTENLNLAYNKLSTQFYMLDKQLAFGRELAFYSSLLQPTSGPWLEAMCGTGRLMVPLLRQGMVVDGVDNSVHMLAECKKLCEQEGFTPQVFTQSITELSLPRRYAGIFIVAASFQLINRKHALHTLKKLKEHLVPGGFLIVELFVPWDSVKMSIASTYLARKTEILVPERSVIYADGSSLKVTGYATVYGHEQREVSFFQYKKYAADGQLLETEQEEFRLWWYYRYEMELLLYAAGFVHLELFEVSLELNPHAVVFKAS